MTRRGNTTQRITEFLDARIAEDEARIAKLAEADHRPVLSLSATVNHPKRLLAECAAKRAIIGAHPIVDDVVEVSTRIKWGFACETCSSYGDIVEDNGYCDTLRALAAVYADHPDYQQEWAL